MSCEIKKTADETANEEMLRMLLYAERNNIIITKKDISKIRIDMPVGMTLENDPKQEKFFMKIFIYSHKTTRYILETFTPEGAIIFFKNNSSP